MIIARTPYRVSLFGGGTDYPAWYEKHGGACLVSAIDKFCYVTLRYQPPFFKHLSRICWSKVELVSNNLDIENPAVRGTLEFLNKSDVGLEVHHQGDLPASSGMGSSSSFVVGLLNAHACLTGLQNDGNCHEFAMSLAKTAVRIEREFVGDEVGVQDQHAAALGGVNLLEISGSGKIRVSECNPWFCDELEERLILFFLGTTRHASEIAKAQVAEVGKHEQAMYQIMQQAQLGYQMLIGITPLSYFPDLLNSAWEIKRSLSPIISNSFVDQVRIGLMSNGAKAVKLIGAGAGGFMLAYVEPDMRQRLCQWAQANKLLPVSFQFCYNGSEIIFDGRAQ